MLADRPLTRIFGGSRASVLEVLLTVDDELSVRKIASLAGVSPNSASEALQMLARSEFVVRREVSGAHLYRLSTENFLIPHLQAMMRDAAGVDRDFRRQLKEVFEGLPFVAAILYGSAARGDGAIDSDVDILLVGENVDVESWTEILRNGEEGLSRFIGRAVHVIATDWPSNAEQKRQFWREIRRDGRPLAGPKARELIRG